MAPNTHRAMISLPPEWEPEILAVKKELFYNDTKSEMYRQLIRLGLDAIQKEESEQKE